MRQRLSQRFVDDPIALPPGAEVGIEIDLLRREVGGQRLAKEF
jgi:hypothetical protein